MRELRKLKLRKEKESRKQSTEEDKELAMNMLNRSMLLDDEDWSNLQDHFN